MEQPLTHYYNAYFLVTVITALPVAGITATILSALLVCLFREKARFH